MCMIVCTGRFQFLHRCYFVWEDVQFFSDRFMGCCKQNHCANLPNDCDALRSIESEVSINFLSLSLDGLPLRLASNSESDSQKFSVNIRNLYDEIQGVSGNFSANFFCTKSVYLLPSRNTYSTRKTRSSIERTTVSKNWIKHLHTLPVLHFNRCLTLRNRASYI
jgi:hypothetical protein